MSGVSSSTSHHLEVAERALALFESHPELKSVGVAERRVRIASFCPDPEVVVEVERLLVLAGLSPDAASGEASPPRALLGPGELVAQRYRIVRKLGEGAAAAVHLAEQQAPVKRLVAIKVLLAERFSQQASLRFQAECDALSRVNHPAIAVLHDAGRTREGLPFVAMEYVDGEPIDVHCRVRQLSVRERAELMIRICRGVHHAHQKGIIHRDLKPGNILVTYRDGQSDPKIIDFGIAKLASSVVPRATLSGLFVGTPEYMSPEQAGVGDGDVDTSSDVYSLGVIFYELLTGHLPIEPRTEDGSEVLNWHRALASADPIKPSLRLKANGKATASNTPAGVDPREVDTDLDSVVLKALSRERERRYSSASEFAADIDRVLAREPVLARPPSFGYQLSRLLRRHAVVASSLGVLLVTAISSAFIIANLSAERAEQARSASVAREHARAEREIAYDRKAIAERMTARGNLAFARAALELRDAGTAMANLEQIDSKFRGWEWHWLFGQADQSEATGQGHVGPVRYLEVTASDELLVSAGDDGTVRLWDGWGLEPLAVAQPHAMPVQGLVLSNLDGLIAVSTDGQSVVATDLETGLERWRIEGSRPRLGSASISQDGRRLLLATGERDVAEIDVLSGARTRTVSFTTAQVVDAGFGAEGSLIFSHLNFVRVVDANGDMILNVFGRFAGISEDRALMSLLPISLWDDRAVIGISPLSTPVMLKRVGPLGALTLGPDGLMATSDNLATLQLRSSADALPHSGLLGHGSIIEVLRYGATGRIVYSGDTAGQLRRWDAAQQATPFTVRATNDVVYGAHVSPDEELVATSGWGTVKLWDTRTGIELATRWWSRFYITALTFSPGGRFVAAGDWNGHISVFSVPELELRASFEAGSERLTAMRWQPALSSGAELDTAEDEPQGLLIVGTRSGLVSGLDPRTGAIRWRRQIHAGAPVSAIAVRGGILASAAGSEAAMLDYDRSKDDYFFARDPHVRLSDAYTGEPIGQALPGAGAYSALDWSPDGRALAAGTEDGTVRVWNVYERTVRVQTRGAGSKISALSWSHRGQRLILGYESGALVVADASSLEFLVTLPKAPTDFCEVHATRDGRALIAAGRNVPLVAYEIEPRAPPAARERWMRVREKADRLLAAEPGAGQMLEALRISPESELAQQIQARGINPNVLNSDAWGSVLVDRADPESFRLARKSAEVAADTMTLWQFENTRALARFRDRDFEGAFKSAMRSIELQVEAKIKAHPIDNAVAAMSAFELGETAEAAHFLAEAVRDANDPMWRSDAEVWQVVDEARRRLGQTPPVR
jgi:serine/threonine protein kinase/WD40 repeat protein